MAVTPTPSTRYRLVRATARDRVRDEAERVSYDRVAAVLNDTVRASGAVECMNSVLRMQQAGTAG